MTDAYYCPQCEADVTLDDLRLNGGTCETCDGANHSALLLHIFQVERWAKMTDRERWDEIRRAM